MFQERLYFLVCFRYKQLHLCMQTNPDSQVLIDLVRVKMPFGKYKDTLLCNLPVSYLEWFLRQGGFPEGKLGAQLATLYEIKLNGLDQILFELKKRYA